MPTKATAADLKQLASDVLARALRAGATDAEVVVYEGDEFSTLVRLGQVETLKESGSRAIGLRVFIGQRTASTSSSDFSGESLARLVEGAVTLARITSEDPSPDFPTPPTSASTTPPTSASTSTTSTFNRPPNESRSPAPSRQPPSPSTPASRTPAEATTTLQPRTRS